MRAVGLNRDIWWAIAISGLLLEIILIELAAYELEKVVALVAPLNGICRLAQKLAMIILHFSMIANLAALVLKSKARLVLKYLTSQAADFGYGLAVFINAFSKVNSFFLCCHLAIWLYYYDQSNKLEKLPFKMCFGIVTSFSLLIVIVISNLIIHKSIAIDSDIHMDEPRSQQTPLDSDSNRTGCVTSVEETASARPATDPADKANKRLEKPPPQTPKESNKGKTAAPLSKEVFPSSQSKKVMEQKQSSKLRKKTSTKPLDHNIVNSESANFPNDFAPIVNEQEQKIEPSHPLTHSQESTNLPNVPVPNVIGSDSNAEHTNVHLNESTNAAPKGSVPKRVNGSVTNEKMQKPEYLTSLKIHLETLQLYLQAAFLREADLYNRTARDINKAIACIETTEQMNTAQ